MPFFLLKLSTSDESLKYELNASPNGTPLCCGQAIRSPNLNNAIRVYWLEDIFATQERLDRINSLEGVESFTLISNVTITIHDPEWKYDNDFIDSLFLPIISKT